MENNNVGIAVKKIFTGIAAAVVITTAGVLINGFLLMVTPLKIETSPALLIGFITVSAVILGFLTASAVGKKGFFIGILSGFFFIILLNILLGVVLGYSHVVSVRSLLFLIPIAGAALGGIVGVGRK
ncbi:MAG: TIGR04086 family membrane protein [Firmicutes bacterium]|nr:TIGR04086 family membrane protein [Bacillota bacterium]